MGCPDAERCQAEVRWAGSSFPSRCSRRAVVWYRKLGGSAEVYQRCRQHTPEWVEQLGLEVAKVLLAEADENGMPTKPTTPKIHKQNHEGQPACGQKPQMRKGKWTRTGPTSGDGLGVTCNKCKEIR